MTTQPDKKLNEMLDEFSSAMLVTRTTDGELRSRPMALAEVENDGTIWLLTERSSPKIHEIETNSEVNVSLQSSTKFVSVSGNAMPIDDRMKIEQLWKEPWKVWFPGGKQDPNLTLLRIRGRRGEYWDNSGMSGIKYLIEAGKAYVSGTQPDVANDPKIHAKVDMARA